MQRETSKLISSVTRRDFLKTTAAASAAAILSSSVSRMAFAAGSDEIKVGLIGCGGRGRGAAINCVDSSAGVKVVALGDLFQEQLEDAKQAFTQKTADEKYKGKFEIKDDRCFSGWDAYLKVINSDVNYVILATPPGFRPLMIEAAVKAKKHVFAEKPVGVCPTGVRMVLAAAKEAAAQNTGIVCGNQRRHDPAYVATIKRLHEGAIGRIISGQCYWTQGPSWDPKPRKAEWSDMEYQVRNWMYYLWLSGDCIVEQHMHQVDVMNWVLKGTPKYAIGTGGRQVRTDPKFGNIWDHFAIEYVYGTSPEDVHVTSMCWQIAGTYSRAGAEQVQGSDGTAIPASKIMGKNAWAYDGERGNPYEIEHKDLIASIRAGKPLNEAQACAESTLTAIMGRTAAYTGKLITWSMMMNSKQDLTPKKLEFGPLPMPPVPMQGQTPFI